MCSDEANVDNTIRGVDCRYKSITIAFDVEDHMIVADDAR
jgi:hypothetical protein